MPKSLWNGVTASTITPFAADGSLRLELLPAHIDWIIGEGVHGISPLGSSGEFSALEVDDRKRMLDAALAANYGRVPVMAGTHHTATRYAVELSKHAEEAGADALLIMPPYYMSPTISQTMDHFRRIAEAVSIPVVLYHNVPGTNINLKTSHLVKMFEERSIAGIKMSNPEPDRICEILQATDRKLFVYAGIDNVAFEGLCHGAHGWISGIPSMVPRAARRLYDAIAVEGDLPMARQLWKQLAPLMRMQFSAYLGRGDGAQWFSVMKATLNLIGPPVGDPCPPVLPLEYEWMAKLVPLLRKLGYTIRGKSRIFALLTVLGALPTLGWSAEPTTLESFRAELAKEDDRAELQIADNRLTVDVSSKSGIGKSTLTRTGVNWPNQIVLRLHLSSLEMFRVSAGKTTINASVSRNDEHEQRAEQLVGKTEVPLKPNDPLWPTIRMLDVAGKPAKKVPLQGGYFEITLPAKMFEGNPNSIHLEWIDFYRG